jgi:hypothetical protein
MNHGFRGFSVKKHGAPLGRVIAFFGKLGQAKANV